MRHGAARARAVRGSALKRSAQHVPRRVRRRRSERTSDAQHVCESSPDTRQRRAQRLPASAARLAASVDRQAAKRQANRRSTSTPDAAIPRTDAPRLRQRAATVHRPDTRRAPHRYARKHVACRPPAAGRPAKARAIAPRAQKAFSFRAHSKPKLAVRSTSALCALASMPRQPPAARVRYAALARALAPGGASRGQAQPRAKGARHT